MFALIHGTVFKVELFDKSILAHVWGILVLSIFIGFFIAYYIYFSLIKNNPAYIVLWSGRTHFHSTTICFAVFNRGFKS